MSAKMESPIPEGTTSFLGALGSTEKPKKFKEEAKIDIMDDIFAPVKVENKKVKREESSANMVKKEAMEKEDRIKNEIFEKDEIKKESSVVQE